jgi:hypothetical protein
MFYAAVFALAAGLIYFAMLGRAVRRTEQRGTSPHERKTVSTAPGNGAEDLIACPVCGTYVPSGRAQACGREGCPF